MIFVTYYNLLIFFLITVSRQSIQIINTIFAEGANVIQIFVLFPYSNEHISSQVLFTLC